MDIFRFSCQDRFFFLIISVEVAISEKIHLIATVQPRKDFLGSFQKGKLHNIWLPF